MKNKTPSLYKAPEQTKFLINPKILFFGSLIIFFVFWLCGGMFASDPNLLLNTCI